MTPTENSELIVTGFVTAFQNLGTASIDSGFIQTANLGETGDSVPIFAAYLIQAGAAAVNPIWTGSGSSVAVAAAIATYRASDAQKKFSLVRF